MNIQDQEIFKVFVEESQEHLGDLESDLLAIETAEAETLKELVNKVFRSVHSIKGAAGFLGLQNIKELAHQLENVMGLMREGRLSPGPESISTLLAAIDQLRGLVDDAEGSNEKEIATMCAALEMLANPARPTSLASGDPGAHRDSRGDSWPEEILFLEANVASDIRLEISGPESAIRLSVAKANLADALESGRFLYWLECDPTSDLNQTQENISQKIQDLDNSGEVLAGFPEISGTSLAAALQAGQTPVALLYTTILEPELMENLLRGAKFSIADLTPDLRAQLSGGARVGEAPEAAGLPGQETSRAESLLAPGASGATTRSNPNFALATGGEENPESLEPLGKQVPSSTKEKTTFESTLRVHVSLLDTLMTLAGELVLSRNQLLQVLMQPDSHSLKGVTQKINLVTSELQEAIMLTRMQPIGVVFQKFPRVVRDLAKSLGKEVALRMEGKEVELDKTIIEGINDPLTHLVRNAIDHGLEPPAVRQQHHKNAVGNLVLRAYHQAGQVNLEISDDGKGLDAQHLGKVAVSRGWLTEEQNRVMSDKERLNLIFRPGFSTAEKVTEVSGRGVGMDVVKSNLTKLGGQIEVESQPGMGATFKIKLPLTLAIIPSLLVSSGGERFAIPQVNVQELLRIPARQVKERLEKVGDAQVVRLREQLLPLVSLSGVLGKRDGGRGLVIGGRDGTQAPEGQTLYAPINIAVVSGGQTTYGLVVDEFHGSEEIVIKPLGAHLKHCRAYAGATIMGDGRVALILDAANLAKLGGLHSLSGKDRPDAALESAACGSHDIHSLMLFQHGDQVACAVPLFLVKRIEKIKAEAIEYLGGQRLIQYQGGTLPIFGLEQVIGLSPPSPREEYLVIVFSAGGREVGLLAAPPVDTVEQALQVDEVTLKQPGVMGSAVIGGRTTLILDLFESLERLWPDWFAHRPPATEIEGKSPVVLLAEDSQFFRGQVKKFLVESGYRVLEAEDGLQAWEMLQEHPQEIRVVVTDIEMPNLDGLALTAKIKADQRFGQLPVIAVTSLAGEEDIARGQQAGVDDYQVKLDKEQLVASVDRFLNTLAR